jgi:Ser/Thr protein kinase RdoA (MazF antagonist)
VAADALGVRIDDASHIAAGYGNENWRVTTADGEWFIAKIGPAASASKWAATGGAQELARQIGVPTPQLIHFDPSCDALGGSVMRMFEWIDGVPGPAAVARHPERLLGDLGRAAAMLHGQHVDRFTSRLDGSAPTFDRWDEYVAYRSEQIVERSSGAGAFDAAYLDRFATTIVSAAAAVADHACAVVCHRDLHLDNVIAREDGSLLALLDFDMAEGWDAPVDLVRLRLHVFPEHPAAEAAFIAGYREVRVDDQAWDERLWIVEMLELVNAAANAVLLADRAYEGLVRRRLAAIDRH